MLNLFRSHHSLKGRSILTLEDAAPIKDDAPVSVFSICKEHKLDTLYLYERDINGLLFADSQAKKHNVKLRFGVEVDIEKQRIGLFLKTTEGYKDYCRLLSKIALDDKFTINDIANFWNPDYFKFVVPFYDSFMFNNLLVHGDLLPPPPIKQFDPTFLIHDHDLPYDKILADKVKHYCKQNNYKMQDSRIILCYSPDDIDALLTYRVICRRKYGKQNSSLSKPNQEFFCSTKFSYLGY